MSDVEPNEDSSHADDASNDDRSTASNPQKAGSKRTKGSRRSSVQSPPPGKKGRSPAVKGLTIPFRTVKKAMKIDPDTPIVQNEAAIMTTMAAELFVQRLAKASYSNAKSHGRNTIKYEDVAEARTRDDAMSFLETMLP